MFENICNYLNEGSYLCIQVNLSHKIYLPPDHEIKISRTDKKVQFCNLLLLQHDLCKTKQKSKISDLNLVAKI